MTYLQRALPLISVKKLGDVLLISHPIFECTTLGSIDRTLSVIRINHVGIHYKVLETAGRVRSFKLQ